MSHSLSVPCQTYYFREASSAEGHYQLEAILPSRTEVYYSSHPFQSSSLVDCDLAQLQLLDEVLVAECNAQSMRFMLTSSEHGAYLCAPTLHGTLKILEYMRDPPAYDQAMGATTPNVDADMTITHGAPVYSLIHEFCETTTPMRFAHAGVSLVGVGVLGIPVFMNASRLRALLHEWSLELHVKATRQSHFNVRHTDGRMELRRVALLAPQSPSEEGRTTSSRGHSMP